VSDSLNGIQISPRFIGEFYGGGIIFDLWRDNQGIQHGLIVSPNEFTSAWSNVTSFSAGSTSLMFGLTNTTTIINQTGHTQSAAAICANYSNSGYSDWYLPSIEELLTLLVNRLTVDRAIMSLPGGVPIYNQSSQTSKEFWSSTEKISSTNLALGGYFGLNGTGVQPINQQKSLQLFVRPIRSF
jgi:hypothetical protein